MAGPRWLDAPVRAQGGGPVAAGRRRPQLPRPGHRRARGQCGEVLAQRRLDHAIQARTEERDGRSWMELSVTDQGVGIAQDRLETILEDFRQGDSSATRRFGGLGLGLALVQRIARAHGGELSVWSSGSSGTRATIALPLDGPNGKTR